MTLHNSHKTGLNIILTLSRQFLSGFLQLGLFLIIARGLGPEGAGTYAVALLLPTVMSQLLNLGLISSNVYFVASGQFTLTQVWIASRDLGLLMGFIGIILGNSVVFFFGEYAFPNISKSVLLTALWIFPTSLLTAIISGLFQASQDFRAFNITILAHPIFSFVGVCGIWLAGHLTVSSALIAVVLSHACALAFALAMISRRISLIAGGMARMDYLRPAIPYGIKAHLSNMIAFLNYRLDIFLVNLLAGPAAVGVYTIAVRLTEQLWMISQATSAVIFPHLSAMTNNETQRRAFTPRMSRIVFWVTLAASGVLATIAKPAIDILFGHEFSKAITPLLILLPGIIVISIGRVVANDFAARGWVGINLALAGTALVINTIANLLLIPMFGVSGAAIATTISYMFIVCVRLMLQWRMVGVPWWECVILKRADIASFKRIFAKERA